MSKQFCAGCPWISFYGDDLMLIAETTDMLVEKLETRNLESKGISVTMGKTKVTICGKGIDTIKTHGFQLGSVNGEICQSFDLPRKKFAGGQTSFARGL